MCQWYVDVPELILEPVLGADVGLSSSSWSPAARQVFGVPGPAGQIDWLLWRHWDREKRREESGGLKRERESQSYLRVSKSPAAIT